METAYGTETVQLKIAKTIGVIQRYDGIVMFDISSSTLDTSELVWTKYQVVSMIQYKSTLIQVPVENYDKTE